LRYAFLCDFDGTIAPRDIGAEFARRFSRGRDAEREALLARWMDETLGSRELTEAQCALLTVNEDEALAFVDGFEIDPAFGPFAREVVGRGDRVLVVSDGFEFYIRRLFERAGLSDVPLTSNRLRFDAGRAVPEFPNAGQGCGRCGNCKGAHAERARAEGFTVVLVGDGYSDRCAAPVAHHVIARGALARWCAARGIAADGFESFRDVALRARALPGRAEAAR
jgi:2-hydroxy-3-keto-5-methylthiopentenyl-1-phosphate phosphatase